MRCMWPRSSAARAPGFEPGGRWCSAVRDKRTLQSARSGRSTAAGAANPSGVANFHAPVAQCIEHRASNAEVAGESPAGSAIPFPGVAQKQRHRFQKPDSASANLAAGTSLRNVNRTSAPGLCAKEIVPPTRGMGSMPSAFRQFPSMTLSSKRIGHPPFKRTMPGSIPARVASLIPHGRVAQSAEARRRERRQCWFDSSRDHHEPEA